MNLYFLVEGNSTERQVYPKLINYFLDGKISQVKNFYEARENNFFLLSGQGYPHIFTHTLKNTILDINEVKSYHYLIICLDAEENTVQERQQELARHLDEFEKKDRLKLDESCKLALIVPNRCLETWFLGNKKIFKSNPDDTILVKYIHLQCTKRRF